jgi:hypothetical protein
MTNVRGARGLAIAVAMLAAVSGTLAGFQAVSSASAQTGTALVKVVAPSGEIKKGQQSIPIDITIDGAANLASFQFDLKFNADIFEVADEHEGGYAQKGDFLGSTGRQVICNPVADSGVARVSCVTLGPTPPGVNGSGKLMTVYLNAIGSGSTELTLDRVAANTVTATADILPTATQGASILVTGGGGFNYLLWLPLIAIGVLVIAGAVAFGAMRMRGVSKPAAVA